MKYTLRGETKQQGHTLKRIIYDDGTVGGWIESEDNLPQDSKARVLDNAKVYGKARVSGKAYVCGNARVFGSARVYDEACVCGEARPYGDARISGDTLIYK